MARNPHSHWVVCQKFASSKKFRSISKFLSSLLVSVLLFSVFLVFLLKCLSGAQKVEIDIAIDHPDTLKVYYSNSPQYREEYSTSAVRINNERSKKMIALGNGFANFVRIDTGEQKGTAKIYGIRVLGFFSSPLDLSPLEINSLFFASPDATMHAFTDRIEVISTGSDPYLYSKKAIYRPQYLLSIGLALIFTLLTVPFLFSSQFDSQEDTASAGDQPQMVVDRLTALDGLRGFAAIMVIADHTWGWFRGVGASGVWIFFALSGFLLARPFISNPRRALSVTYMSQYIRRRFLRILPMYYVYIFVVFAISGRFNLALMHCLFLQGDGHLWAIPQEVIFYLLWPLVVILIFVPLRQFPRLSLIILLILIISWNRFIGIENFWLLGMNHIKLPLFFGVFLTGAFFSFVYSLLSPFLLNISCRYKLLFGKLASSLGLLLLLFFVLLSTGHILGEKIIYSQMYFGTYGFFAGAVILCALLAKGHALHDFLSIAPLRAIGTVGFSLYLVHPLVKRMVEDFSLLLFNEKIISFPLFLATLSASYFLAQFTYRYIEKPVYDKGLAPDRSANQVISAVRPTATAFNPASIPPPHSLVHKEK